MKNAEKYPSSATALARWKLLPPGRPPFDEWLMADSDPLTRREHMLLAARNLLAEIDRRYSLSSFCHTERLALIRAVREESAVPMARYELYPSPDAAHEAYLAACRCYHNCEGCPYHADAKTLDWNCQMRWLYDSPPEPEIKEVKAK